MGVLQNLCGAYLASADGKARLDCGCLARPGMIIPCVMHRREVHAALLAACEANVPECQEGCCDPA